MLTEPTFFDGSLEHLAAGPRRGADCRCCARTSSSSATRSSRRWRPGADAILLIVGALTPAALAALLADAAAAGVAALVEVHDAVELAIAADAGATIIGVNSRNLRTLAVEPGVHEQLAPRCRRAP